MTRIRWSMQTCQKIDELRMLHEDMHGCDCFTEVAKEFNSEQQELKRIEHVTPSTTLEDREALWGV